MNPALVKPEADGRSAGVPVGPLAELPPGLGYVDGPVFGIYLHGISESPAVRAAGARPWG